VIGIRRIAVAAAVMVIAAALQTAMVVADSSKPFDSYGATSESYGLVVRVIAIQQAGTFPDLADEYFPHTKTDIDSLPHAKADGEFFDPGGTVRIGPNLGNQVFLVPYGAPPVFPNYPYIAQTTSDANAKRDVDLSAGQPFTIEPGFLNLPYPQLPAVPGAPVGAGFGFGAGTAKAHADASPYSQALGSVQNVGVGVASIGSIDGESSTRMANGVVTAISRTTMHNIDLLSAPTSALVQLPAVAVIHIDTATVTGKITTSGPGTAKTEQSASYNGVTVAGIASTIDQNGLHVGGNGVPPAAQQLAQTALNTALQASNMKLVNLSAVGTTKPDGSAEVHVGGFGLSYTDNQNVAGAVLLGQADLTGRAVPALPLSSSGGSLTGSTFLPGTSDSFTGGSPGSLGSGGGGGGGASHPGLVTVSSTGGGWHMLILPLVALFSEVALIAMVVQANRWRKMQAEDPDLLLAL
jgi:hypothetical protein